MERFAVYILASGRNGTLYVGVTNDFVRRVSEHRAGAVPGFTQRYAVRRLVHVEYFHSIDEARVREARLKRWRRAWKLELIEAANPEWRAAFANIEKVADLKRKRGPLVVENVELNLLEGAKGDVLDRSPPPEMLPR